MIPVRARLPDPRLPDPPLPGPPLRHPGAGVLGTVTAVEPARLARLGADVPAAGPVAAGLHAAIRALADVLALTIPAGSSPVTASRAAGGRSALAAWELADQWARAAGAWAADVAAHAADLVRAGDSYAESDLAGSACLDSLAPVVPVGTGARVGGPGSTR